MRLEQQPRVLSGTRTESRVGNNGRDVLMSQKTWMSRVTGRRYDHREVGGRVAPGAATESNAWSNYRVAEMGRDRVNHSRWTEKSATSFYSFSGIFKSRRFM